MDEEHLVPSYYTIEPDLTDAQVQSVLHALRITPIQATIIIDAHDGELAQKLSDKVIRSSFNYAHRLALELAEPVIIILGKGFNAYYADGHSEELSIS
jgi:prepilin-type processing-associated H-X9-DG protein